MFPEPSTIRVLELEAPLLFTAEPLVVEDALFTDELLEDVPAVLS